MFLCSWTSCICIGCGYTFSVATSGQRRKWSCGIPFIRSVFCAAVGCQNACLSVLSPSAFWERGQHNKKQTSWPESASELYRPKLVPNLEDRRCRVVSATDSHGRILGFLDWSRYFFLSGSSTVVFTRLSGPRSRPTTSQKTW
jgi:hypothetical protein